jgi:UDP-N-acetylmuramate--alanine ligase
MNIFFSGLGGVGMGPLAEIVRDAGYGVFGSDVEEGLMTDKLLRGGIDVHIGPQSGSYLKNTHDTNPIDWVVYTPAIKEDHPELVLAKRLGIKTAKRGEYLAHFIKEKNLKLIAVSGTHGKTTTTGMMIWAMRELAIPVSYSIGTTLTFGPSGTFDPASEYFVYECDEFDRNFLYFSPYLALIPSLDYDHPDTFPTPAEYLDAFREFAVKSDAVIAWDDQHAEAFDGLSNVTLLNESKVNADIAVIGHHNRRNAELVQAAISHLKLGDDVSDILLRFPGTDRRFEKLADNLYSDYGHHPVEIAATLQLAREISDHVVLVYQPHQNIRQHEIKDDYTNQFELADEIYWLPTYLSREDDALAILKPEELISSITNKDHVHVAEFDDALWSTIQKARAEGALVIGMGAGAIDGWLRTQVAKHIS